MKCCPTLALGLLVFTVAAAACGGKKSAPKATTADLSGAVRLVVVDDPDTGKTLRKVLASGDLAPVISVDYSVDDVATSSTHLLVRGDGLVTDTEGNSFYCRLLAIPLTAAGTPTVCLSTQTFGQMAADQWGRHIATRQSEVFFTETNVDPSLWRWDGVGAQSEQLMQSSAVYLPFAADGAANICVSDGQSLMLTCGDPDAMQYALLDLSGGSTPDPYLLQVGSHILSSAESLDLTDLTMVATTGGGSIPLFRNRIFPTNGGGFIGIAQRPGGTGLVKVSEPNELRVLGNGTNWELFVSGASRGYVYGSGDLRQVDVGQAIVGTSNLLSSLSFLSLGNMYLTTHDRVRLDGTGTNGLPLTVFIDEASGALTTDSSASPVFQQVIPLQ